MIEFVEGQVAELSPTHVVVNCNGMGYLMHISLYSYEQFQGKANLRVLTHLSVKEDSHTLFGFANATEREIFRNLIGVSGVGPATARVILSSLNQKELVGAILNGNVALLKSIKGIGPKAAQRLILELQDKMGKLGDDSALLASGGMGKANEALEALMALGFGRSVAEKAIAKVRSDSDEDSSTEELIKKSLKLL
ncbi:MAG: Holliday junction branch migration protein RuvA [Flavobacteriales bacterium]|nr:Holliday junction branch migration protein RuvA [Bacteroidota bacterium]MCB9240672.1 Holliday junction branch migration protein RuvA [Flavobacteriales bacterium]